jgi:hypothetical protein
MLERVARHGDGQQRASALSTLSTDHLVRTARAANAPLLAGRPKRIDMLGHPPGGRMRRTI